MYDNLTLYRLASGELIVADEMARHPEYIEVKGPHSIVEQPGQDNAPPQIMLQPSIPHDDDNIVTINRATIVLDTDAPANIQSGYRQALSNIVMPDSTIKTPSNVTPLSAGLRSK